MKAAYQGQPGAFGHEACLSFLPAHEPVPKAAFAAVVEAVLAGETELGILPVRNSCAGPVEEVQDLLAMGKVRIVETHILPVRMHLMGIAETRFEDVRKVVSHPVALAQCRETLMSLGLRTEPATNTAVAARTLAETGDPNVAVLASEAAARIYGLTILRRDVHDRPDNATTFSVIARHQ